MDLALLTDGLRAEREQGITIDVAYRHFATPRRRFIIADTPGHAQYTRNMVTGASTADLAIVLVDAREGLLTQSRRHAAIAGLLGIPRIVLAVNKMDLVDYDQDVFRRICGEFRALGRRAWTSRSSRASRSPRSRATTSSSARRTSPGSAGRRCCSTSRRRRSRPGSPTGRCGCRSSGSCATRSPSTAATRASSRAAPCGSATRSSCCRPAPRSRVSAIDAPSGTVEAAGAPLSIAVRLEDQLDVARGAMIARAGEAPRSGREIDATRLLARRGAQPARAGATCSSTPRRTVRAVLDTIHHTLEVEQLTERPDADCLSRNEIGRVTLRTSAELFFDRYADNRTTGSFILIDEATNETVGAGMIDDGR